MKLDGNLRRGKQGHKKQMVNIKQYICLLFVCAGAFVAAFGQSKGKGRYIYDYQHNCGFGGECDTLHAKAFFSLDSFAIVYMIKQDSDYSFPIYRGSWQLLNDTVAELTYGPVTKRMIRFEGETMIQVNIGGTIFIKM